MSLRSWLHRVRHRLQLAPMILDVLPHPRPEYAERGYSGWGDDVSRLRLASRALRRCHER